MNKITFFNNKILLNDLIKLLKIKKIEFIKKLSLENIIINNFFDFKTIKKICFLFNFQVLKKNQNIFLKKIFFINNKIFIIIIGNVNNGKTTLFDFIFKKNRVLYEYGKISQEVYVEKIILFNKYFYFFDMPGHNFFFNLIKENIKIVNVVIFLISIDNKINDLIINYLKIFNNKLKIIICFNKIDKNFFFNYNYFKNFNNQIKISTKNGFNIKKLVNLINNIYLKNVIFTNFNYPGFGFIISTSFINNDIINKVFIMKGVLKINDFFIFNNVSIKIIEFYINNIQLNKCYSPEIVIIKNIKFPLDNFFYIKKNNILKKKNFFINKKNLINLFIKTNNYNIAYSLYNYYNNLSINKFNILKILIGNFTENDLNYCITFNCKIILINSLISNYIYDLVIKNNIKIKKFFLINEFIDYFKNNNLILNKIIGIAIIKKVFQINKKNIAGCLINYGIIKLYNKIKIYKNKELIFKGEIESLKKNNLNVKEVFINEDCGIAIKNFNNIEINLEIKSYE